ncbi:aminotransferase class V-fold PLP-dependent enzyme [Saccharolobus solfataricus]|uniref:Soluble hydrogenase, small subunit n=3 Tax=Saccharolobus solfataricus TaxID=2287 RepID=Q97ZK0_SACS2|nr:aminotransferase class V-fold PLP-dependent enzyme [Saccharolobus solfataricus]AAK41188.1 Soluble hydrogenase, small subunit [Saccharolobus solfataricus P2]AKA74140.1 aminotransferase class V-fold PLP-dependent enzyme [Saccharolobus solfataricus]AKA76838.1 aminotransferase class V-fold PLP-dependent enzyme [Saccharolobus solfataricus]AKA79531.1 aminotransferase class V-fold PLP-dependent enzyme [Saccharolobus solfataricus]AZF68619.1 aminotransferase class V-fold PLP-dependent enzyme [Saccha
MMLIPGPVNVPYSVLQASLNLVNHRSEKFRETVKTLEFLMNKHFGSTRVALLSGSGTLAVESMVYSLVKREEKVITFPYGEFGHRLEESLIRRGAKVISYQKKLGESFTVEEIKKAIEENKDATTVALVHNETSTGIAFRDLKKIADVVKGVGLKLLVDSVSGFAAYPLYVNQWKIDCVVTGSQKALASIPGVGFAALSEEGVNELVESDLPSYLDLSFHLKFQDKGETPFTPTVGAFFASRRAAELLDKEGIENRWKRHEACARYLREVMLEMGFKLLGNDTNFSNTVVAAFPPIPLDTFMSELKKRNIEISKGMGELRDKIVRIGILGVVDDRAIRRLVGSMGEILKKNVEFEVPRECKLPEELKVEVLWD